MGTVPPRPRCAKGAVADFSLAPPGGPGHFSVPRATPVRRATTSWCGRDHFPARRAAPGSTGRGPAERTNLVLPCVTSAPADPLHHTPDSTPVQNVKVPAPVLYTYGS